MRRDWKAARSKCDREPGCRVCGAWPTQAAHIVPRSIGGRDLEESICPLCVDCHRAYDDHELDLLPHLTKAEQAEAVMVLGIERARARICGERVAA